MELSTKTKNGLNCFAGIIIGSMLTMGLFISYELYQYYHEGDKK